MMKLKEQWNHIQELCQTTQAFVQLCSTELPTAHLHQINISVKGSSSVLNGLHFQQGKCGVALGDVFLLPVCCSSSRE